VGSGAASLFRWIRAPFLRMANGLAARRAAASAGPAVPMTFEGEGGWGVCAYQGGEAVGKSGYVRHDFSLPSPDNVLPLTLGQHVALCCLDNSDKVVQGEFYPYSERSEQGKFSILLPEGTNFREDDAELGPDRAAFVSSSLELRIIRNVMCGYLPNLSPLFYPRSLETLHPLVWDIVQSVEN